MANIPTPLKVNLIKNGAMEYDFPLAYGNYKFFLNNDERIGAVGPVSVITNTDGTTTEDVSNQWSWKGRDVDDSNKRISGIICFNSVIGGDQDLKYGQYFTNASNLPMISLCGISWLCTRSLIRCDPGIYDFSCYYSARTGFIQTSGSFFMAYRLVESGNTIDIFLSKSPITSKTITKDIIITNNFRTNQSLRQLKTSFEIKEGGDYYLYFSGVNGDGMFRDSSLQRYTYKGTGIGAVELQKVS